MNRLPKLRSLKQYRHFNNATAGIGVVLFAVVGTILLFRSHAATPFASVEPENGSLSRPDLAINDTTASGGKAVKFGGSTSQPANWFVSVGGTGDCSQANPCGSINAAYQKANQGDVIVMAAGTYGGQNIVYRSAADTWSTNVTVQPQSGTVTINGYTNITSSHVTLKQLVFNNGVTFATKVSGTERGNYGKLDGVSITHTDSANILGIVGTTGVQIINSRLTSDTYSKVIISVQADDVPSNPQKIPTDILIENNEIGPAYAINPPGTVHQETIHLQGSTGTTIRRNLIWEGGTSSTIQADSNFAPELRLLIENNYIAGCGSRPVPTGAFCGAFFTLAFSNNNYSQYNNDPSNITVRNNTIRGPIHDYCHDLSSPQVPCDSNGGSGSVTNNVTTGACLCTNAWSGNVVNSSSFGPNMAGNIVGNPTFTSPTFGGIDWGIASSSVGYGKGVPAGQGYTP